MKGVRIDWVPFVIDETFKDSSSFVIVVEDSKKALYIKSILEKTVNNFEIIYLEPFDSLIYESVFCDKSVFAKRATALNTILNSNKSIVLTTIESVSYLVPPPEYFRDKIALKCKDNVNMNLLVSRLIEFGYSREEVVQDVGQFAVRGGIIDIFMPIPGNPVRIDFFSSTIESIREFDALTQISNGNLGRIDIRKCSEVTLNELSLNLFKKKFKFNNEKAKESIRNGRFFHGIEWYLPCFHEKLDSVLEYFAPGTKFIFDFEIEKLNKIFFKELHEKYEKLHGSVLPVEDIFHNSISAIPSKFEVLKLNPFEENEKFHDHKKTYNVKIENSRLELLNDTKNKRAVLSVSSNGAFNILVDVLSNIQINVIDNFKAAKNNEINIIISQIKSGFISKDLAIYTERELFGRVLKYPQRKKQRDIFNDYSKLNVLDYVVHENHGVALFEGMVNISVSGIEHDFLSLLYKNNDRLYVPVENIALISRYGGEGADAELDTLKSGNWNKKKTNVRKKLLVIANNLLQIAAKRKMQKIQSMKVSSDEYDRFCKGFPYIETEDQIQAIDDIVIDLNGDTPMDRLVCGDVGFGKTEVALRAAFIVAMNLRQVVVLAPTTVLVSQHYKTFTRRFEGFGIKICQLSRFASAKELKDNIAKIEAGKVDIIIATHAVLSNKIKFHSLGLVIIDEEQHFGVKQKELMRALRGDIHFMTLSATPIPRTLQMAISGVKELSIIATPPSDRLPVKTFILDFEEETIKNAIEHELKRGGQVFFVSPRVEHLDDIYKLVIKLFPEINVSIAHGKSTNLEEIIRDFCDEKIDVLVSTNIIDSGVDIPNANTIIIHRVDLFGLSQLYQLRGRVGRSKVQAYAYLLFPENRSLTKSAEKRLEVLKNLDKLGAGFSLASHDLDIRGAGNMLGEEQSGYIKEVGVELYQAMLQEAILMLKTGEQNETEMLQPQVNIGVPVLIPENYIEDINLRLSMYRKIGSIKSEAEIDYMEFELSDRFGKIPIEVLNLLCVIKIMIYCRHANINKVDVGSSGFSISFFENKCYNTEKLLEFLNSESIRNNKGGAKIRCDQKIIITKSWRNVIERTTEVLKIVKELAEKISKS